MTGDPGTITALLARWSDGDTEAFPELIALAYDDLRAIAHRRVRGGPSEWLDTTALVHEAYLKLAVHQGGEWAGRAQFFAFASRAMRHILVDHARHEGTAKRGGNAVRISFEESEAATDDGSADVLEVDDAIERLAGRNPRMAKMVELRFFGGLTVPEVAEVLAISPRTVEREWMRARAYLLDVLRGHEPG
jgi:RNA polymerase sigma factor (TIGR02999 family)